MNSHERGDDFDRNQFLQDKTSAADWSARRHVELVHDEVEDDDPVDQDLDVLGAIMVFLADGLETGSLGPRAAAFLSVVKPDLLGGLSKSKLARRLGCSAASVQNCVTIFREHVPIFPTSLIGKGVWRSRASLRKERRALEARRLEIRKRELELRTTLHDLERRAREASACVRDAEPLFRQMREKWAELDAAIAKRCEIPPETEETRAAGLDPFERARREILSRRGVDAAQLRDSRSAAVDMREFDRALGLSA